MENILWELSQKKFINKNPFVLGREKKTNFKPNLIWISTWNDNWCVCVCVCEREGLK